MSTEPLHDLLKTYDRLVQELSDNIDEASRANSALVIARAEVEKSKHKLGLVKENIMCQKKLIDIGK